MNIKKIVKTMEFENITWTVLAKIFAMICFLATDIIVARILDVDKYAEWTFFYATITMLFYLAWFGINASMKVFISKQEDAINKKICIQSGIILRFIVSVFFFSLIIIFSGYFAKILGYPDKYPHLLELFRCAGIIVFFNSFTEFFKELYIGMQIYKGVFFVTITEFFGNLVFGVIGALILKTSVGVAYGYALAGLLTFIIGFYTLRSENDICFREEKCLYKAFIKKIFIYAIPLAIINISGMILIEMDTFMLGIISTSQEVSTYSIAKQLCSKATHINYALATATLTSFSIITRYNLQEKKEKFKKISYLNVGIVGMVAAAIFIAGPLAVKILYGASYQRAGIVIRYLIPYYILYSISNFYSLFLDFQGKAQIRSIGYCIVLFLNFIFNLMFIPRYGAIGASIATAASLVPYIAIVLIMTSLFFRSKII